MQEKYEKGERKMTENCIKTGVKALKLHLLVNYKLRPARRILIRLGRK